MSSWKGTVRDLRGLSATARHAVPVLDVASAEGWYVTAPAPAGAPGSGRCLSRTPARRIECAGQRAVAWSRGS